MPRDGAIIFADLIGKLDVLRVECAKCGRAGQYPIARMIEGHGRDAKIVDLLSSVSADCPRRLRTGQTISVACGARTCRG
jgi:hypothetical protein